MKMLFPFNLVLLLLCSGRLVSTVDIEAPPPPDQAPKVFKTLMAWSFPKSASNLGTGIDLQTIAMELRKGLDMPFAANQEAVDQFTRIKKILESRNPEISFRWPDIFHELTRLPNSASAVLKLLRYNDHVLQLTVDAKADPFLTKAPPPPIWYRRNGELHTTITSVFESSPGRPINLETGKALISWLVSNAKTKGNYWIIPALQWAVRMGLEEETQALISKETSGTYQSSFQALESRNLIAVRTAIEAQQDTILNQVLEKIALDETALHSQEWRDLWKYARIKGNKKAAQMIKNIMPADMSESSPFWAKDTSDEKLAQNWIEHLKTAPDSEYQDAVKFALHNYDNDLLSSLIGMDQASRLSWKTVMTSFSETTHSMDGIKALLKSSDSKIPFLQKGQGLAEMMPRTDMDRYLLTRAGGELVEAILDRVFELHRTEFLTFVTKCELFCVEYFEKWYRSKPKTLFTTNEHASTKKIIVDFALKQRRSHGFEPSPRLWRLLLLFLDSLTEQENKWLTRLIKGDFDKEIKGRTYDSTPDLWNLQRPMEIMKKIHPDPVRRIKIWSNLLITNSFTRHWEDFHQILWQPKKTLDKIGFHTLLLSIKELESLEMMGQIMHNVAHFPKFNAQQTKELNGYLLEVWADEGRAWVEGKATSPLKAKPVTAEPQSPRLDPRVPALPRPHF
jgi:hypothetical protein